MATLKEVAKLCGVTPATVSYILNGRHLDRMLPETIQRVREAAVKLDYRPHPSARSLVTGRTEAIGIFCPGHLEEVWKDSYLLDVMLGIFYQAAQDRYAVQVATDDLLAEDRRQQPAVDGWVAVMSHEPVPTSIRGARPTVYFDAYHNFEDGPCYWADNARAGEVAGKFCADRGLRAAFVLPLPLAECPFAYQERWRGFRESFGARKDLLHSEPYFLPLRDGSELQGETPPACEALRAKKIDVLVTSTDLLGYQILRDVKKMGIQIPRDGKLIGIDNLPQSRWVDPALSSVDIGALELGRQTARQLLARLQKKEAPFEPAPPKLIERQTSA
ncbi:MAG: LacI family DNA-binding transcriptional regulator [Verrucomicrobiae bacterium]|nr:LacI family DNA-binding transcriptional regulator [Verrucomicrobiae bacterium]